MRGLRPCVAALRYVYDHEARELPKRLTRDFYKHDDLAQATLHVHLRELHGSYGAQGADSDVQRFADHIIAERGVRHGHAVYLPLHNSHSHGESANCAASAGRRLEHGRHGRRAQRRFPPAFSSQDGSHVALAPRIISNQDPFNNATPISDLGGLTEYQDKCDLSGGFRSVEWLRLRSASAVWHAAVCVVIDTTRDVFKTFFRYPIPVDADSAATQEAYSIGGYGEYA